MADLASAPARTRGHRLAGLSRIVAHSADPRGWIAAMLVVAGLMAWVLARSSHPVTPHHPGAPHAVASPVDAAPPAVAPVAFLALDADAARAINAKIPFSTAANPAALPYRTDLTGEDLSRAIDCLAAAALYEAGNDRAGQAAVAQVVLNRVRHPAFPHSICGVVFQGADRATGCQFTFTCDGALARRPSPAAWLATQAIATDAIRGAVVRRVGLATHYHTDWVVPYWSGSLDKITAVHTHLFFRWRGWWGTPPAFAAVTATAEPHIAKLASLSDAHKDIDALAAIRLAALEATLAVTREDDAVPAPPPQFAATPTLVEASAPDIAGSEAADAAPSKPVEPAPPAPRRRVDPCRAMRHVEDRIGFCAGR